MSLDFTYKKYAEIISAISKSKYQVITIADYILNKDLPEKYIILRHDIDLDPYYQLKFAKLEFDYNIHTSYYFRFIDKIFKEDVITQVYQMGHEVGYHYEVFTKAHGDEIKAMDIFKNELAIYQKNWNTKTVCPHGGSFVYTMDGYTLKNIIKLLPKLWSKKNVFSSWSNFDIWDNYRFENFRIIGDAYRSVDFSDILYLSDTGRSWEKRFKRLDKVVSNINPFYTIRRSNDIIDLIKEGEVKKIYLLIHFEQWKDNFYDWVSWYIAQVIRRSGKKLIFKMK